MAGFEVITEETGLFMELWTRRMVYTKGNPRIPPEPPASQLSWDDLRLRDRADELHEALSQRKLDTAFGFLCPDILGSKTSADFVSKFEGPTGFRLVKWKIQSVPLGMHRGS